MRNVSKLLVPAVAAAVTMAVAMPAYASTKSEAAPSASVKKVHKAKAMKKAPHTKKATAG